jgi:hypothetical protein
LVSSLLSLFWENKTRLMKSPCCLSVCLCIVPILFFSFSVWSMSYQRKVGDYFFPELLVNISNDISETSPVTAVFLNFFGLRTPWCHETSCTRIRGDFIFVSNNVLLCIINIRRFGDFLF